jgi:hypothetical protein
VGCKNVCLESSRIALEGLSPREIATLNRLLQRIRANLEEAVDE